MDFRNERGGIFCPASGRRGGIYAMHIDVENSDKRLREGLEELRREYGLRFGNGLRVVWKEEKGFSFSREGNVLVVCTDRLCRVFRAVILCVRGGRKECPLADWYDDIGFMADCSNNVVPSSDTVKRLIRTLAVLGYNYLQLYTEDTYRIEGEPYFGYMRGAYTGEELKEIVRYAAIFGIEVVPCIQTLAHLGRLFRWPAYRDVNDCFDILLAEEEKTYRLINAMFGTLEKCFVSRRINIGMDEAFFLGAGNYMNRHGYRPRAEIYLRHLRRVLQIAAAHGFSVMLWSDGCFRYLGNGDSQRAGDGDFGCDKEIPAEFSRGMGPENGADDFDMTLLYADYEGDYERFSKAIAAHKKMGFSVAYAGAAWTWAGYAPQNRYSMEVLSAALSACEGQGVRPLLMTNWGDDNAACSFFAGLPVLVYAAWRAFDGRNCSEFKQDFSALCGCGLSDFLSLEAANLTEWNLHSSAGKDLLFNDCFLGLLDAAVPENAGAMYASAEKKLRESAGRAGKWKYLFFVQIALVHALAVKAELGIRTRKAFLSGDREKLRALALTDYPAAGRRIGALLKAVRKQWMAENKPFGEEVQEVRLGGLIARVDFCRRRLLDYCDGRAEDIPELREERLDFLASDGKPVYYNHWSATITPGAFW